MRSLYSLLVLTMLGLPAQAAEPAGDEQPDLFSRIDANGDGRITLDEAPADKQRLLKRLLRTADKNNDGALSRDEFQAEAASDRPERPLEEQQSAEVRGADQVRQLVDKLDANRDGRIEKDEAPPQYRELVGRLLAQGDADKNGAIDRRELARLGPRLGALLQASQQGKPGEMFFQRLDANADGKVTADEVPADRKEMFDRIVQNADKDGDGAISKPEFAEVAKRMARDTPSTPPAMPDKPMAAAAPGIALSVFDRDGDGSLSNDEIAAAESSLRRLDANRDGTVSRQEIAAANQPRPTDRAPERMPEPEDVVKRLMQLDRDSNGSISKEEAPPRMKENFDRADANSDGQLDRTELLSVAKQMLSRAGEGSDKAKARLEALKNRPQPKPAE
jgi:Ca2+-binding EF-hand superfamily protein